MAKSALNEIASKDALKRVWKAMYFNTAKRKRDGYGIDEVSLNQFHNNREQNNILLGHEIRHSTYMPSLLYPHFLKKENGKERVICVPTVRDRLLQRSILSYLHNKGYTLDNEISFGFISGKGNGVEQAAKKAIEYREKYPWTYKADISAFFDSINRETLKTHVQNNIKAKSLHSLINQCIDTEIYVDTRAKSRRIRKQGITKGVGLRQGMPISPYLANLYLAKFDNVIIKQKIPMLRYADDLIAFANSETECQEIHQLCQNELAKLNLNIHDIEEASKTEIASPEQTVEFLGIGISKKISNGYELIITDKQMAKIKRSLLQFADLNYCKNNKITISKLLKKIDNKIAGYDNAYEICENNDELVVMVNECRKRVLSSIFSKSFKINLDTLTHEQKWFLELESL